MRVLSLFSGVGGMDLGLERAGHNIVGMCEIDPKARSVLARHWPGVPIHDDVTTFDTKDWYGRVDVVAGGSPCQDLSVAGQRAGLDGQRSSLFWHQCRIADGVAAPWIIWENVAGVLSSNRGADFAAVLWGITGALPELPDGKRWGTSGVVVGPKRTAVWRLFDAQYFGVAQRRRRVFVVAGVGRVCGPEILFESESVCGNPAPSRTSGQETAGTPSRRSDKDCRTEFVGSLTAMDGWERPDNAHAEAGWLVPQYLDGGQVSDTIDVSMAVKGQMMPDKRRMFAVITPHGLGSQPEISGTLGAHLGGGRTTDLDGRGAYVTFVKSRRAQSVNDHETWVPGEVAPTLNQFDVGDVRTTVAIPSTVGVRRLTPRECERLMSFPDDWTRWDDAGAEIADSHRYRFCGNGVVSNVTEWIGRRLP